MNSAFSYDLPKYLKQKNPWTRYTVKVTQSYHRLKNDIISLPRNRSLPDLWRVFLMTENLYYCVSVSFRPLILEVVCSLKTAHPN